MMTEQYFELFKLKYEKVLKVAGITYKVLASYNTMAFSLKELNKETETYVHSLLLNHIIKNNNFDLETLKQLDSIQIYTKLYKKYKLKKLSDCNSVKDELSNNSLEILKNEPKITKVIVYFDSIADKVYKTVNKKVKDIFFEDICGLFSFIDNHDIGNEINEYQDELMFLKNYLSK